MTKQKKLWTLLTILSTFLWGVSGLFAKFIFELEPRLTPLLLSQIRMLSGGLVLLALASYKKEAPLALWQNKQSAKSFFGQACDLSLQEGCEAYKSLL